MKLTWLDKQFLEVFKTRPHWLAADIIETLRRANKVLIKKNFSYKVKYFTHRMLHGSMKEHYSKIGSYIQVLTNEEPNSVFSLTTIPGGQLIAATGRDANEQMYPVARAVVEGENNDSYEWFFKKLKMVMAGLLYQINISILTMVAQELLKPDIDIVPSISLQTGTSLIKALTDMRKVDHKAAEAFLAYNPTVFCMDFINTTTKTDVIVNNMTETFNAYIIDARAKHVIYMVEDIRTAMMQRARARLEIEKDKFSTYEVFPSSTTRFQVKQRIDEVSVDLVGKTSTCRKWDLTGIPCSHAVAAIFNAHGQTEEYVDDMYKKDAYLRAYGGSIAPCPSQRHWPKVILTLNPPPIKVGPGRPRKKKRRDPHEDPKRSGKLTKHGLQVTCSVCKSKTHNKRRCPVKDKVVEPPTKRDRGRPRMNNEVTEGVASTSTPHHTATAHPTDHDRK
ncbi:uncharacterized protein LOC141601934 [Silene latifolia]|uniref:uncharacterized protein LOC141601934 n=1 Tax=Silene latifolia TaxID=37657 RepID=UPI003D786EDF